MEIPDESFFSTLARINNITQDKDSGNFTVIQNHVNKLKLEEGLCPRQCDIFTFTYHQTSIYKPMGAKPNGPLVAEI